jgi:2-phospho-L-lactate guanylyltransferase (CobY/MobA/RfbA family)
VNVYPVARSALLRGDIDLEADAVALTLVGAAFVYDPTDAVLTDVAGTIGTAVTVSVTGINNGEVTADPVTFTAVADGTSVRGLVLAVVSSAMLVAHIDRRADAVPLTALGNGNAITFTFPDYLVKI